MAPMRCAQAVALLLLVSASFCIGAELEECETGVCHEADEEMVAIQLQRAREPHREMLQEQMKHATFEVEKARARSLCVSTCESFDDYCSLSYCKGCDECKNSSDSSDSSGSSGTRTPAPTPSSSGESTGSGLCVSSCKTLDDCSLSYCKACDLCTTTKTGFGGETEDGEFCMKHICTSKADCENLKASCSGCTMCKTDLLLYSPPQSWDWSNLTFSGGLGAAAGSIPWHMPNLTFPGGLGSSGGLPSSAQRSLRASVLHIALLLTIPPMVSMLNFFD